MGTLSQAFEVTRRQMEAHFGDVPQCDECRHRHADGCTCDAFPDEIPGSLFINLEDHRRPYKGDHGIRFASREESVRSDSGGAFGAIFSDLAGAQVAEDPRKKDETRSASDKGPDQGSYEAGSEKRHEAAVKAAATRGSNKQKSEESRQRAERAKASYIPADKLAQDRGDKRQKDVAGWLGMEVTSDNKAMDSTGKVTRGKMCGVEVKTFTRQKNDKVTMHPESLDRKNAWLKANKAIGWTVVIDDRDKFEGGAHKAVYSGNKIWIQKGFGSFRIGSMHAIDSPRTLRAIIHGEKKLPE